MHVLYSWPGNQFSTGDSDRVPGFLPMLSRTESGLLGAFMTHDAQKLRALHPLKEVWRLVLITPLFELRVGIHNHAAPHPRDSKQLNVIARVTIDKHSIFGSSYKLFHLQETLYLARGSAITSHCSATTSHYRTTALCCCRRAPLTNRDSVLHTAAD